MRLIIVTRHASIEPTRAREKGGRRKVEQKLEQILPTGETTSLQNSSSNLAKHFGSVQARNKSVLEALIECWNFVISNKCNLICQSVEFAASMLACYVGHKMLCKIGQTGRIWTDRHFKPVTLALSWQKYILAVFIRAPLDLESTLARSSALQV